MPICETCGCPKFAHYRMEKGAWVLGHCTRICGRYSEVCPCKQYEELKE